MLRARGAFYLGVLLLAAGCVSFGTRDPVAEPETCLLTAPPWDPPPAHREAFNVTDAHLERFPVLATLFASEGGVVTIDCPEGRNLFQALRDEGADVVLLDQATGHNAYLTRGGTTLHVTLEARA